MLIYCFLLIGGGNSQVDTKEGGGGGDCEVDPIFLSILLENRIYFNFQLFGQNLLKTAFWLVSFGP